MRVRPVAVEPVRDRTHTLGSDESASPATGPYAGRIWRTPSGRPASLRSGPMARATSGVNSEGFQTAVHPAARAAETFFAPWAIGKFHGVTRPATPAGTCLTWYSRPWTGCGWSRPLSLRASSPNHWKKLAA